MLPKFLKREQEWIIIVVSCKLLHSSYYWYITKICIFPIKLCTALPLRFVKGRYGMYESVTQMLELEELVAFWGYHIHLLYNNLLSPNYSYCILHNHLHCSTPVISFCYLIITQLYNYCINTVASDAFVISGS